MQSRTAIITTPISDHLLYFILLNYCNLSKPTPPKFINITKTTPEHIENFKQNIVSADLVSLINTNEHSEPNISYNILHNALMKYKDKCLPTKHVKFKKNKHKGSRWIALGIIKSISYRDKLFVTLKKTNLNNPNYEHMKVNLQTYNKIVKQTIRLAKINYYKTCFQNRKHNLKNTWQTIKCILSKSDTITKLPDKLIVENNILPDQQKNANHFSEYFTNISPSLASTIQLRGLRSYKRYIKNKLNHTFEFHSVNDPNI